jgi:PAS domain S-box-containing protein
VLPLVALCIVGPRMSLAVALVSAICIVALGIRSSAPHAVRETVNHMMLVGYASFTGLFLDKIGLRLRKELVARDGMIVSAEARLRNVFATMDEGVVIYREDGTIEDANPAAVRLLGVNRDQLLGRTSFDPSWRLIRDDGSPFPREDRPEVITRATGKPAHHVLIGVAIEHQGVRWLEINARRIESQKSEPPYPVVATFHDVTEARLAAEQLVNAAERAEAGTRAKSVFLSQMSHEIRTPLNGLIGTISLLETTSLTPEQREYVVTAQRSGAVLLRVVSDVLDLARIESGKVVVEQIEFDAVALVEDSVHLFDARAKEKGLALAVDLSAVSQRFFVGDPVRIRQILHNLIGNAVKFTSTGGITVRASVLLHSDSSSMARFVVEDTGVGVAKEKISSLFQPFEQADAAISRRYGGSGLGLAICRELAHLMGGTIVLASEAGKGTRVTVELPLRVARMEGPRQIEAPNPHPVADSRHLRILVAEDNIVNQLVVTKMLEKLGHSAIVVSDGQGAVEAARTDRFDVVLMDAQMPKLSGPDATREIRKQGFSALPIIAVTAGATPEERDACIQAGMNDYLTKPITIQRLAEVLARVVN